MVFFSLDAKLFSSSVSSDEFGQIVVNVIIMGLDRCGLFMRLWREDVSLSVVAPMVIASKERKLS